MTKRRHQFTTFKERLTNLKIPKLSVDLIRNQDDGPEEKYGSFDDHTISSGHFSECLAHWRELNLSSEFTEISKKVSPMGTSVEKLLYNKDAVAEILLTYLEMDRNNNAEPILDLWVAMARDLREEFFATEKLTSSYLEILFDNLKLSGNLGSESGTSDSLVKTAFVGLNELIRLAVKIRKENKISRDIFILEKSLEKLSGYKYPEEIVKFSCQSLSSILRRAGSESARLELTAKCFGKPIDENHMGEEIHVTTKTNASSEWIPWALALFSCNFTFFNVNSWKNILGFILENCQNLDFSALAVVSTKSELKPEEFVDFFAATSKNLKNFQQFSEFSSEVLDRREIFKSIGGKVNKILLASSVIYEDSYENEIMKSFAERIFDSIKNDSDEIEKEFSNFVNSILKSEKMNFQSKCESLRQIEGVTWIRRISADLIHFFVSNKEEKNLISICETIANLGESCGLENPLLFRIEKDKQFAELLTAKVLNSLKNPDQENSSSKDVLTLLLSMNYMAPLDDKGIDKILDLSQKKYMDSFPTKTEDYEKVLLETLKLALKTKCPYSVMQAILPETAKKIENRCSVNLVSLEIADILIGIQREGETSLFSPAFESTLIENCLSNVDPKSRLFGAKVLEKMNNEDENFRDIHLIFSSSFNTQNHRELARRLENVVEILKRKGDAKSSEISLRFLFGCLFIEFSLLWKSVYPLLTDHFKDDDNPSKWQIIAQILENVHEATKKEKEEENNNTKKFALNNALDAVKNLAVGVKDPKTLSFLVDFFQEETAKDAKKRNVNVIGKIIDIFSVTKAIKNVKEYPLIRNQSFVLMSQYDPKIQRFGLDFAFEHFKGVKAKMSEFFEALLQLKSCKDKLRALIAAASDDSNLEDKLQESETKDANRKFVEYLRVKDSVERQIYSALIWGILLKSMKEDPKRQRNTRRLVMEASKALDDDCVFEILKDAVEKHAEESPALVLDVCVSAITCLKSEDQIGYAVTQSLELLTASGEDTFAKGVDSKKRSKFFIDALKVFKGAGNHIKFSRDVDALTQLVEKCFAKALKLNSANADVSPKFVKLLEIWLESPELKRILTLEDSEEKAPVILNALTELLDLMRTSGETELKMQQKSLILTCCRLVASGDLTTGCQIVHASKFRLSLLKILTVKLKKSIKNFKGKNFNLELAALVNIVKEEAPTEQQASDFQSLVDTLTQLPVKRFTEDDCSSWIHLLKSLIPKRFISASPSVFKPLSSIEFLPLKKLYTNIVAKKIGLNLSEDALANPTVGDLKLDESSQNPVDLFSFSFFVSLGNIYGKESNMMAIAVDALTEVINKFLACHPQHFKNVGQKLLSKHVTKGLRSKDDSIYTAFMGVFRSVVLAVAKYNKDPKTDTKIGGLFAEAEILIDSKDDDSDYLENFKHLQMHRRTRALRQLVTKTEDEELEITGATLRSLVLPIADRVLFNPDLRSHTELVTAAMDAIAVISSKQTLAGYLKIFDSYVEFDVTKDVVVTNSGNAKKRNRNPTSDNFEKQFNKQKFTLVSKLVNSFHFSDQLLENASGQQKRLKALISKLIKLLRNQPSESSDSSTNTSKTVAKEETALPLYAALAKVCRFFPEDSDVLGDTVHSLLVEICGKLKTGFPDYRRRARQSLCDVLKVLGPKYLSFVISTLDTTLKHVYQRHVYSHTVNACLNALKDVLTPEVVESIESACVSCIMDEWNVDVHRDKKVKAILKKTPEASKSCAVGLTGLLAEMAGPSSIKVLARPFLFPPQSAENRADLTEKSRAVLTAIVNGLRSNSNLERDALLLIAHSVLSGRLYPEAESSATELSRALAKEFGVDLLNAIIKGDKVTLDEIRPFFEVLPPISTTNQKNLNLLLSLLKLWSAILSSAQVFKYLTEEKTVLVGLFDAIQPNINRFYSMKDNRAFVSSCVLIGRLLRSSVAFDRNKTESLKHFFLSCIEKDTHSANNENPNAVLAVLKIISFGNDPETVKKLCGIYVENCSKTASAQTLEEILSKVKPRSKVLEFMITKIGHPEIEFRKRAITEISRILSSPNLTAETLNEKVLYAIVQRFLNEDIREIKEILSNILKNVLQTEFESEGSSSSSSLVKFSDLMKSWADKAMKNVGGDLCGALAAETAVLAAATGHEKAVPICKLIVKKLSSKLFAGPIGFLIKSDIAKILTGLLVSTGNEDGLKNGALTKSINETLNSSKSVRNANLELVTSALEKLDVNEVKLPEFDKDAFNTLLSNGVELMKRDPSESLIRLFKSLIRVSVGQERFQETENNLSVLVSKKLVIAYNFEGAEFGTKEFIRRNLVLSIAEQSVDIMGHEQHFQKNFLRLAESAKTESNLVDVAGRLAKKFEAFLGEENASEIRRKTAAKRRSDVAQGKVPKGKKIRKLM